MQVFHKTNQQVSLFSPQFCDSDKVSDLIDSSEKAAVTAQCKGDGIHIVDCRHPNLAEFIDDAGGLDLTTKHLIGPTVAISHDIPVIPPDCFNLSAEQIESEIVGLRLYDILSIKPRLKSGYYYLEDGVDLDFSVLNKPVFKGKKVVLFCTGIDTVIEKLWWLRNRISLCSKIASAGLYAVVGMNFSLFIGECPVAQLINMNKSALFCESLSKLGVAVIPHVYAVNDIQRAKWVSFLSENSRYQTVAINTQLQKDGYSRYQTALTTSALLTETTAGVILAGHNLAVKTGAGRVFSAKQSDLKTKFIKGGFESPFERLAKTESPEQTPLVLVPA